jgi:hypothetical protein
VIELLAVGAAGAAGTLVAGSALRRWWRRTRHARYQREHERFAHYVYPEAGELRIGTTLEPAGAAPDHEPLVTVDDGFTVRSSPDRRLHIPAGARLQVRAFTGARRRVLDHLTTPDGTVARVSFDVPREVCFWILDAPAWAALRETDEGARGLRGVGPWEITTRLRPISDGPAGSTQVTIHPIHGAAWLYGLDGADAWLVPRAPDAKEIVLLDLSDPSTSRQYEARDDQVAGIMPCVAACLWLRTGLRVRHLVSYVPGRGKLVNRTRSPWPAGQLAELQRGASALLHGAAEPDLEETGATVMLRTGGTEPSRTFTAPLTGLVDAVTAELATRGIATPMARPPAFAPPRDLEGHARVLADLVRIALMSPVVRGTPRVAIGRRSVTLAARLAAADPGNAPAQLAWVAACLAAHAIDDLAPEARDALLAAVAAARSADDPLYLLAPRILAGLGQLDAALAARDARRRDLPTGGYRDADAYERWLDRIE